MSAEPITTHPLDRSKAAKLVERGTQVRVCWEWISVLRTSQTGGSTSGHGTSVHIECLLTATDGSGLAWQPRDVEWGDLPVPGSTTLLGHEPGDPSVWAIEQGFDRRQRPDSSLPRGWSGGDERDWVPWLAEQRATFRAGPQVVATVRDMNKLGGSRKWDTDVYDLTFDVAGRPVAWRGRLAFIVDPLQVGHEVVVVLGADGQIVALDTDERYVSEHGQCLVWSTAAKDAHLAEMEVLSDVALRDAALSNLRHTIRTLAAKRGHGFRKLSEEDYLARVTEAIDAAVATGRVDESQRAGLMDEAVQA